MDIVTLEGKQYVKASVIAKQFRYTADYIGQLCRGKKVDARLVGRTWFVNVASLEDHRAAKYQKPATDDVTPSTRTASKNYSSRIVVAPQVNKKTIKILESQRYEDASAVSVRYEQDDFSLIPRVAKMEHPKFIHVNPADSKKIRIQRGPKNASFIAEALPDVALSGNISVVSVTDEEYAEKDAKEVSESNEEAAAVIQPIADVVEEQKTPKVVIHRPMSRQKVLVRTRISPQVTVSPTLSEKIDISPQPILTVDVEDLRIEKVVTQSLFSRIAPAVVTVTAVILFALIVSAQATVYVTQDSYRSSIKFQAATIFEIFVNR